MNFTETYEAMELLIEAGSVPLIIGESGIGKSTLVSKYAMNKGLKLINIDANLLKEGEIGGLPMVKDGRTWYATHIKLSEIEKSMEMGAKGCLLFIDELNRCDHAVAQELMNLVLNREINGFILPDKVYVTCAMNPPSGMDEFRDSDYRVVDLDPAQRNRFVWLKMDSDPKEWIKWGLNEGNIHHTVIEFISTFDEHLHHTSREEMIDATPRSWERISDALKVFEKNPDRFSEGTLYSIVKGNVGTAIGSDFMNFLKENRNPLLKADEIFRMDSINQFVKDEVSESSHSRLYILMMNMVKVMDSQKDQKSLNEMAGRTGEMLLLYPKDLRISLMKEIRSLYGKTIYNTLLNNDIFLEAFFEAYG